MTAELALEQMVLDDKVEERGDNKLLPPMMHELLKRCRSEVPCVLCSFIFVASFFLGTIIDILTQSLPCKLLRDVSTVSILEEICAYGSVLMNSTH